jgi:hypothetical protein
MTYSSLKSDIASWLQRSDLTAIIPSLVTLAHAEIDSEVRGSIREDDRILTLTNGTAELPTDFRRLLNVSIEGMPLIPIERQGLDGVTPQAGQPRYYRIIQNIIEVYPTPAADTDMTIIYERSLPVLELDDDTNEVLDRFPALYLYGALKHSAPFLVEDERLPVWGALYVDQLTKANKQLMAETMTASLQLTPSGAVV